MVSETSGAVTEPRSRSSFRNQARKKPRRATGAAYRKTSVMLDAYACRAAGRSGGGRAAMPRGSAFSASGVAPGGRRTPRKASASLSPRRLAKTVPKMATPKEAPMERKKVAPEVATPRSS